MLWYGWLLLGMLTGYALGLWHATYIVHEYEEDYDA